MNLARFSSPSLPYRGTTSHVNGASCGRTMQRSRQLHPPAVGMHHCQCREASVGLGPATEPPEEDERSSPAHDSCAPPRQLHACTITPVATQFDVATSPPDAQHSSAGDRPPWPSPGSSKIVRILPRYSSVAICSANREPCVARARRGWALFPVKDHGLAARARRRFLRPTCDAYWAAIFSHRLRRVFVGAAFSRAARALRRFLLPCISLDPRCHVFGPSRSS